MDLNGRLSISGRSSPALARMDWERSRVSWFCVIVAVTAVVALKALPLSVFLLLVAISLCLLLTLRTPLAMLVVLLALAPLRTLIATESATQLPLDIGQILLALYLGIWLANGVVNRWRLLRISPEPVLMAAIGLCLAFAIGAYSSEGISNWLTEWLKWAVIAVMIWHLSETGQANWRWLIFAVLVSAVANGLVGLYIFFGGSGANHLLILGRFFRAFGTFGQPNPFGGFMGNALPLALMCAAVNLRHIGLGLLSRRRIALSRIVLLAVSSGAAAMIAAALPASWRRGAWLGLLVAPGVMTLATHRRLVHGISFALASAAVLSALWSAGLLPRSVVNRVTTAATDLFTISDVRGVDATPTNFAVIERLAHWQAAISMAQDNPVFGIGLGNYAAAYDEHRLISWEAPLGHAHNLYLNFLAETGVVGLLAYLAFWIAIFRVTWQLRRHPDRSARALAIGLLGCWTYIAVHSVFDNLYVNNLFLHIGVLLSVLAILNRQVNDSLIVE